MSDEIILQYSDDQVKAMFARLAEKSKNLRPAMKDIGEHMILSIRANFDQGKDPEGNPWKPLSRGRLEEKADKGLIMKTLVATGHLRDSMTYKATGKSVKVGTVNSTYAAVHQFGAQIPARVILPVNKKALFWKGARHPVKKVNAPAVTISKREFLGVGRHDKEEIIAIIEDHILQP